MKTALPLYKFIRTGHREGLRSPEKQRITIVNLMLLLSGVLSFFYLLTAILYPVPYLVLLASGNLLLNGFAFRLNARYRYAAAKALPLAGNSFMIFLVGHVYDFGAYMFLYYFSVLAAYVICYDFRKDAGKYLPVLIVTLLLMLLSIGLPHGYFGTVSTGTEFVGWMNAFNKVSALVLFLLFIYLVVQMNFSSEQELNRLLQQYRDKEAELKRARRKAEEAAIAKSRFLSNMSHELRTPLNGIIGTANILLHEAAAKGCEADLTLLRSSTEQMLGLVNDLLDFSKIESGQSELDVRKFSVKTMLDNLALLFREKARMRNIQLQVICDGKLDRLLAGDELRIRQVLLNLISNAVKFTPGGGEVTVKALLTATSNTFVSVHFSVTDTGIGIPADKLLTIFESFSRLNESSRRSAGGTGLGLSISQKLVELMGGKLSVKSELLKGSTFSFTIELFNTQDQPDSFISASGSKELKSLKGVKILLAEDNEINMAVARKFLKRWEIDLAEARNGAEALELFSKNHYDMLLLDLEMPVMDGFDTIREVRKKDPLLPAVAFTAAVFENMQETLTGHGFSTFIQKPFRPEDLYNLIVAQVHPVNNN